jgi:plasmid stabilization system protein ParE
MTHEVRLLPEARADLPRLKTFLAGKSPRAARQAGRAIEAAIRSLAIFPDRGRNSGIENHRELIVRYGRDGYVVLYRVEQRRVIVARIFHGLEDR